MKFILMVINTQVHIRMIKSTVLASGIVLPNKQSVKVNGIKESV